MADDDKKEDINAILERAAKEEDDKKAAEEKAKKDNAGIAQVGRVAEEKALGRPQESEDVASKPTSGERSDGIIIGKSQPFLLDDKEESDNDPMKDVIKRRESGASSLEDKINDVKEGASGVQKIKGKIKIKLGNLAFIMADVERGVFSWAHLNAPLMADDEILADYQETYAAWKEVIDNRIGFEHEYGDVINAGIVHVTHLAKRGARYYLGGKKSVDRSFLKTGIVEDQEEESEEQEHELHFDTLADEAKYYAGKYSEKHGGDLTPH